MDHHLTGELHVTRTALRATVAGMTAVGMAVLCLAEAAGASAAVAMPAPPERLCGAAVASTVTTSGAPSMQWLVVAVLAGVVVTAGCATLSRRFRTAGWLLSRTRRVDDVDDADDSWLITEPLVNG